MQVRKRPVVVEAHQIPNPDIEKDLVAFLDWCTEVGFTNWASGDGNEIEIQTLEGVMTARSGDWVIKGVENEFWAIKESIFDKTYDIIPPTNAPASLDFGAVETSIGTDDADYSALNIDYGGYL